MIDNFKNLNIHSLDLLPSQLSDNQFPTNLLGMAPIKKIDSVFLKNFKSFSQAYVGPFLGFTSIIGPNGSGKSNILQALMFCCCSEHVIPHLLDVRELINRQGRQTYRELTQQRKMLSVQVNFILKNNEKLVLERTLDGQSNEIFKINYELVNKKLYQNFLTLKSLNGYYPNYAIWQGQIDRLLLKQPKQMTQMFENISGSIYYKKQYEDIEEVLQKINEQIQRKMLKRTKMMEQKKHIKTMKNANHEFNKWDKKYEQVLQKLYYLRVVERQLQMKQQHKKYEKIKGKQGQKVHQIEEIKLQAQRDYNQRMELQQKINITMNQLIQFHSNLKSIDRPVSVLKNQQMKELSTEIQEIEKENQNLGHRKEYLQGNQPQIPSSQIIEEYSQIYKEWQVENSALNREVVRKNNQLLYLEGIMQTKKSMIMDHQQKVDKFKQNIKNNQKQIQGINITIQQLKEAVSKMKYQGERVYNGMQKGKKQMNAKKQQLNSVYQSIEDLQIIMDEDVSNQKQKQLLRRLVTVQGFKGILDQKIKPIAAKYNVCFSIIFSNVNKYILCESQEKSKLIAQRLKEINQLKTVVILSNIQPRVQPQLPKDLKRIGMWAYDVMEYDNTIDGLSNFLRQFLKGKVVCATIQDAYRIRNMGLNQVKEIYTVDGTILRRDGTISAYGNPESFKKNYKYAANKSGIYEELNKLNKQKLKLQTDIKNLSIKYDEKEIVQRNLQISKMQRKVDELQNKKEYLKKTKLKQPQLPKSIQKQIKQLQNQKNKIGNALAELQKMMQSSQVFKAFMEKHNIDHLQTFRNSNNLQHIQKMLKKKHQNHRQISELQIVINENSHKLQKKLRKRDKLYQQLNQLPKETDKKELEERISEKQSTMKELRVRISKLSTVTRAQIQLKSQLPALQAHLQYSKQKNIKQYKQLAQEYGIEYEYPVSDEKLEQQLDINMSNITYRKIQTMETKLENQKKKLQQTLQKQNMVRFVSNIEGDQEKVLSHMKEVEEEVQELSKQREKYGEDLQNILRNRKEKFAQFIKAIRPILNQTYEILTEQEDGGKGTIDLFLENESLPFQYGVYFTPTPPTKRFVYDLEQLSGGQKSIASLALQYSIALATQSPFLILDETDAFLDIGNVKRFLKLIEKTINDGKIQLLIITHKEDIFTQSSSLVGVTRPRQSKISEVYSLNLLESALGDMSM